MARNHPVALVADVDPDFRARLCHALASLGLETREAGDGLSALRAVQKSPPDILCLDLALPALSGLELVARMRRRPSLRAVPALFITDRSHPQDRAEVLALEPSGFLAKPPGRPALAAAVGALLNRGLPEAEP